VTGARSVATIYPPVAVGPPGQGAGRAAPAGTLSGAPPRSALVGGTDLLQSRFAHAPITAAPKLPAECPQTDLQLSGNHRESLALLHPQSDVLLDANPEPALYLRDTLRSPAA